MPLFGCQRKGNASQKLRCYHAVILHSSPTPPRHRFWRFFYDRVALAYDTVLRVGDMLGFGSEERIRREIIAGLSLPRGTRILDVGCGTATNRVFLQPEVEYVGVDLSINMLRQAAEKLRQLNIQGFLIQADAVALPFQNQSATLVIAMGVLQHVAEPEKAIAELQRAASRGAQLLIIDERRAAGHILPADAPVLARRFGDYFVTSLRKD